MSQIEKDRAIEAKSVKRSDSNIINAEKSKAAEADVPAEWNVGDVILDLYEVKQIHKGGGMGWVYRVHHRNWNLDLAVKTPRQDYFQTEAQKENFVRECETWINLGLHPHTVSCFYVRRLGDIPRVFAEYVEGGSLADWIKNGTLYEGSEKEILARILDIAIQFAWGVNFAHEQDFIHQDVKPANVMMTPDGVAKVTDFGLAKARVAADEGFATGSQQSILVSADGMTPAYCSPEQAKRKKLTRRTDVWSWAVSVLEIFTGEVKWPSGSIVGKVFETYLEEKTFKVPMPKSLADLLRWCFKEHPDDRPKEMSEIASTLKETYQQTTRQIYLREEPKAIKLLPDSLNNQAISFLDLGQPDEAEKLFEDALRFDPHHLEATYNRGLLLWRSGRITDKVLVRQLEEVRKTHKMNWRDGYYLGLIHIERGDANAAIEVLEESARKAPEAHEIQQALATAQSGQELWRSCALNFKGHIGRVASVTAPEVYKLQQGIASAGSGKELWEVRVLSFDGHIGCGVASVSISTDGHWALSGNYDQTLELWELPTGQCLRTFEGHTEYVTSVSISPDRHWGLSGSGDQTLRLWELTTGKCLRIFEGHTEKVNSVSISPDGRLALSGGSWRKVELKLWELTTGKCLRTFKGHTEKVESVCFSPDGRWALSGSGDQTLKLWEVATGQCVRTFKGHTKYVTSVSISPDGCWVLSGSGDQTLRLWELATGEYVRTFEGHTGGVASVCFSPDGCWALSGSGDRTLKLWEVATGQCVRTFEGHTRFVNSVSISPDGHWALSGSGDVLSGGEDQSLKLWKLGGSGPPGRFAVTLPKSAREVDKVAATVHKVIEYANKVLQQGLTSEAAKEIARVRQLPGYERNPELIDLWRGVGKRGRCAEFQAGWYLRSFKGHTGPVNSICLSPDGHWALSGSGDKTLRLWEVSTGPVRAYL